MRKVIVLFAFILCFTSCKKDPFFSNFDTIEYYHLKSDSLLKIIPNDSINEKINSKYDKSTIDDDVFFKRKENFEKKNFSSEDIEGFKSLFIKKVFSKNKLNKCFPLYREVLILKNSKEVVGIVGICFDCKMYYIKYNNQENKKIQVNGSIEGSELETLLKKYQTQ